MLNVQNIIQRLRNKKKRNVKDFLKNIWNVSTVRISMEGGELHSNWVVYWSHAYVMFWAFPKWFFWIFLKILWQCNKNTSKKYRTVAVINLMLVSTRDHLPIFLHYFLIDISSFAAVDHNLVHNSNSISKPCTYVLERHRMKTTGKSRIIW